MLAEFLKLTEEEKKLMMDVPLLITILIAGADWKIDETEKKWAYKIKVFRSKKEKSLLNEYYKEAGKHFKKDLLKLQKDLPSKISERNTIISSRLEKLNNILPKLDIKFSIEFYNSILSYAEQIAKSSGGVLGFASTSTEEKKWLGLKMIKSPEKYYY